MKCSSCGKVLQSSTSGGSEQGWCKKCTNLEIACPTCHKRLTVVNEYGMFCEDLCGLEESKEASKVLSKMIGDFDKMFDELPKDVMCPPKKSKR